MSDEEPKIVSVTHPERKGGKPSKLTPQVIEKLVQLVSNGNYVDVACASCGIPRQTYYGWLRDGRTIQERFPEHLENEDLEALVDGGYITPHQMRCVQFLEAMTKAAADSEAVAVLEVKKAYRDGDWKAAMTFLERRFPQRWRRRTIIENADDQFTKEQRDLEQTMLEDEDAVAHLHAALGHVAELEAEVGDEDSTDEQMSNNMI